MSAVLEERKVGTRRRPQLQPRVVEHFSLLSNAPAGVKRLRELILTLAVRGKLVDQDLRDQPVDAVLEEIGRKKARLSASGRVRSSEAALLLSDAEAPFTLPAGWRWVRLGSLLQKIGAGSTPLGGKDVYVPSGVMFLRSQNIWNDGLHLQGVAFITAATHAKMAGTVVQANDLLFNITGASIGRCAAVPANFDEANVSQHVAIVRPFLPALTPYLHKALISPHVQQAVMDVQVGVSREGLSVAKLKNFLIPMPPLAEQLRIVARVDELMHLCDVLEAKGRLEAEQHARLLTTLLGTLTDSRSPEELAANWQRVAAHFDLLIDRPEAVNVLEDEILRLAVRGHLVEQRHGRENQAALREPDSGSSLPLPLGWMQVKVRDVVEMLNGYAFKSDWFTTAGVRLVRNTNVGHGRLHWRQTACISAARLPEFAQFSLAEGDLVLSLDRPIISTGLKLARICSSDLPCLLLQRVARLKADPERLSMDFLEIWMSSDRFVDKIDPGRSNGVPHISTRQVGDMLLCLPPLEEQHRIVGRVKELRRLCADLRERLAAQEATQSRLADALIESVTTAS